MKVDDRTKNQLMKRLEKARTTALNYLTDYDPRDLILIMDAIDEDLECLDCWDDENDCPEFGYSHVDLLQQLDYNAGVFMFEDKKLYEIDVIDIFATFAFFTANEGIDILKKSSEIAKYSLAAESCIDAFNALHYGIYAQKRVEIEGGRVLEVERLSDWSATATAARNKLRYEDDGEYIVNTFEELCKKSEDILYLEMPNQKNPDIKKLKKYKIRSNGHMDLDVCARFIFHSGFEIPSRLGKVTDIACQIRYVKKVIINHEFGKNVNANVQLQTDDDRVETIDESVERRVFPKKVNSQPVDLLRCPPKKL